MVGLFSVEAVSGNQAALEAEGPSPTSWMSQLPQGPTCLVKKKD